MLHVAVKDRGGATVLDRFRQEGCLKARLPRPAGGEWTTLVTINSAGGVAQGDRLLTTLTAGAATRLTVTSQAAERYYRAVSGDPARVQTTIEVGPGAALEWLPQETILFDQCALHRRLDVSLAPDAAFLGVELLVFGRARMGETVQQVRLRDTIRLSRGGALVWHDAIRLEGAAQAVLHRAAVAAGAGAVATLLFAAAEAPGWLDRLRAALAPFEAGASAMTDLLVARIVAPDGACARAAIVAGLGALRGGRTLPRLWGC